MIGIMGAMREEIELLRADLTEAETRQVWGSEITTGTLEGQRVAVTQCGIGKVNAAMSSVALLSLSVSAVIFTGVAGGVDPALRVGDVVVSRDLVQHDVDVTPLGYPLGLIPDETLAWAADPELRERAVRAARSVVAGQVLEGRIASGDVFVASPEKVAWLRDTFGAACAEMEGAAVAQVCHRFGVPFVVIRSMSDTADGGAHVDYPSFMPQVARTAKAVVRAMLREM